MQIKNSKFIRWHHFPPFWTHGCAVTNAIEFRIFFVHRSFHWWLREIVFPKHCSLIENDSLEYGQKRNKVKRGKKCKINIYLKLKKKKNSQIKTYTHTANAGLNESMVKIGQHSSCTHSRIYRTVSMFPHIFPTYKAHIVLCLCCVYEKAVQGIMREQHQHLQLKSHIPSPNVLVCVRACVQLHQIGNIHSHTMIVFSYLSVSVVWVQISIAFKWYERISQLKCHWLSINRCICTHILLFIAYVFIFLLCCLLFFSTHTSNVCVCIHFIWSHHINSTNFSIFLFILFHFNVC